MRKMKLLYTKKTSLSGHLPQSSQEAGCLVVMVFCLVFIVFISYKAVFTQTKVESLQSRQDEGTSVVRSFEKQIYEQ